MEDATIFDVVFFGSILLPLTSAGKDNPPSSGTEGRKDKREKRQRATHQSLWLRGEECWSRFDDQRKQRGSLKNLSVYGHKCLI